MLNKCFLPTKKPPTKPRPLEPPDSSFSPSANRRMFYACLEFFDFIPSETVQFSSYLSFCLVSLLPGQTSHGSQVFILMASFSLTSLIIEHLLKLLALIILLFECKYFAWRHNKYTPDFGASERKLLS